MRPIKRIASYVTAAVIVAGAGVQTVPAAPMQISVPNASFENPTVPSSPGWNDQSPDSWVDAVGGGLENQSGQIRADFFSPTQSGVTGEQVIWLDTESGGPPHGHMWVDTGHAINSAMEYTLTADIGNRPNTTYDQYQLQLFAGDPSASGTELASLVASKGTSSVSIPQGGMAESKPLTYDAQPADEGSNLFIQLRNPSTLASSGTSTLFDNVQLSAVPEPASLTLLGIGSGLILIRGRRQAK